MERDLCLALFFDAILGTEAVRMSIRKAHWMLAGAAVFLGTGYALDRSLPEPFRELPGIEYRMGSIPLPPDLRNRPNGCSPA